MGLTPRHPPWPLHFTMPTRDTVESQVARYAQGLGSGGGPGDNSPPTWYVHATTGQH